MGIIAAMKVGYRSYMLGIILDIFDAPDGYKKAEVARARRPRCCKVIYNVGKATVLDAMNLINQVWDDYVKYALREAMMRCWMKAAILSLSEDAAINNEFGSASLSIQAKTISKKDCSDLCSMLGILTTISGNITESGNGQPPSLVYSISDDN